MTKNANKVWINSDVIRAYELAFKALQEGHLAREALIASQEVLIMKYEGQIDRLIDLVEQQRPFQQTINLQNAQFAGDFVNAEVVQSHQIGGDIYNTDNQEHPD